MKLIEQHVEDRCKLVKVIDTCKSFESILCLRPLGTRSGLNLTEINILIL